MYIVPGQILDRRRNGLSGFSNLACVAPLPHRSRLAWFEEHQGEVSAIPGPLADGVLLVSKPKGIYKPGDPPYTLSIRINQDSLLRRSIVWGQPAAGDVAAHWSNRLTAFDCHASAAPLSGTTGREGPPTQGAPRIRVSGSRLLPQRRQVCVVGGGPPCGRSVGPERSRGGRGSTSPSAAFSHFGQ
jgi:hypothetical protein